RALRPIDPLPTTGAGEESKTLDPRHLVAARPPAVDPASFRSNVAKALGVIQRSVPLAGALACAGIVYVVFWELVPVAEGAA
ncbi:hypothetical protein AAHH79_37510, partial [Burkholderia pseudomallei]